jgi:hypothetical protein
MRTSEGRTTAVSKAHQSAEGSSGSGDTGALQWRPSVEVESAGLVPEEPLAVATARDALDDGGVRAAEEEAAGGGGGGLRRGSGEGRGRGGGQPARGGEQRPPLMRDAAG